MKLDMHVHSRASHDGCMTPEILFQAARRAGLDGLAVCDHNTLGGARAAQAACPADLFVVPGAEYVSDAGHVLAYFIEEGAEEGGVPRLPNGRFPLYDLARFVHEQGGLLVAAHPYRHRTVLPDALAAHADGWELYNARQMAYDPATTALAAQAAAMNPGVVTAGSDAHRPAEVGGAFIDVAARDERELLAALLAGRYTCRGRPARRIHEAWGKLGAARAAFPALKGLARLAVYTAYDVRDALMGRRRWETYAPGGAEEAVL